MREQIVELRKKMKQLGVDAYLIVSDDFHASEYVGEYFKCREYISGFDGSAGMLVVTSEIAGLWTDGRYFIQAAEQLQDSGIQLFKMGDTGVPTIPIFLEEKVKAKGRIGFDGRTVKTDFINQIKENCKNKHIEFVSDVDLANEIWEKRPKMSAEPIWLLDMQYAGESRKSKIQRVRAEMKRQGADTFILTSLDDIAWLFNMRGNDVLYNPVVLSYVIMEEDSITLYMNEMVLGVNARKVLESLGTTIKPYLAIYQDISNMLEQTTVMLDESVINYALRQSIPKGVKVVNTDNPTTLMKAIKNSIEMQNVRMAHVKDGVAVTRLLYWIKHLEGIANVTELDICRKLEEFRKDGKHYLGQSFAPIAATGAHGAIVHYEPTEESNIPVEKNSFILLDTGGQYLEGTTDITRTIAIGKLSKKQKTHYTAVLRGNLNLAAAKFKYGCTGVNFDYLAREPLWEMGLDYNHGTGHGVGYLLNVHEGPNAFRWREANGNHGTVFEKGMITSDEPGFYLEGKYGIRLENLLLCKEREQTVYGQFMEFETLTLVPFDRNAIDIEQMDSKAMKLLNEYHQRVYETISPFLGDEEKAWLQQETRNIQR